MAESGELPLLRELPALMRTRVQKDASKTPSWRSSPFLRASNTMNSPLQRGRQGNEWKEYCHPSTAGAHSGSFKKADVDMNKEAFHFELDSMHDEECSSVHQESIIEPFDISGEQRGWEYVTRGGGASSNTSNATESHEEGGGSDEGRDNDEAYSFFISRSITDGGRRCLPPTGLSTGLTRYSERSLKRESSYKYSFSPSPDDDHYQKMSHEAELMYYQCIPTATRGREVSARMTESRPLACSYATKRAPQGSSKYILMSAQRQSPAPIEDELIKSELDSSELIGNKMETYRVRTGTQWRPHSAKGLNTSRRKSLQHQPRSQKVSSPNAYSSMNSTVLQKGPMAEPFHSTELQDDRNSDVSVGSLVARQGRHRLARSDSCEDRHCKEPSPVVAKSEHLQLAVSESKDLVLSEDRPRSLSQKYRPRVFGEIVGQHLVAQSLSSAISKEKIAPVYLFQGPQGTGKTSAARIFAAALLCIGPQEQRPCGHCSECVSVTSRRNSHVREVDAASHNGIAKVKVLLEEILASASSHYKVFIIDECHVLTTETWNALLKILEEPPMNVVFILITTDPDQLPRTAVSRCQKFPFPKIKDAEIIKRLIKLASHECLNLDLEVLKLIASRSDGSLRDAENILDQLSLLGQEIDSFTVHELVGSASEERMLSLLDSALLADTVNTIKRARELVDSGVQPLSLMSQMATLIIDILAGKYEFTEEQRKGFFRRQTLSEDKLERLRKAVKTLSEAEKQLRVSNEKMTWLTAALLQLGPDRSCMFPGSHAGTSVTQSPMTLVDTEHGPTDTYHISPTRSLYRGDVESPSMSHYTQTSIKRALLADEQVKAVSSDSTTRYSNVLAEPVKERELVRPNTDSVNLSLDMTTEEHQLSPRQLDDIWFRVVQNCRPFRLRQSLYGHGRLVSISLLEVSAVVCLEFFHSKHKTRCESSWQNIANAFEAQLGCPVEVKISLVSEHGGEEQGVSVDFVTHSPDYGFSMQPDGGLVNPLRPHDMEHFPVVSQAPSDISPKEIGCLRGNTSSSLHVCPGASKLEGPTWRMSNVMSCIGAKEWPTEASEEQLDKAWICDAEQRFSPRSDSVKMFDGEIIEQSESCEHTAMLPTKAHFTQEPHYQNPHGWSCEDVGEIVELDILSPDSHTFGLHHDDVEDESRRVLDGLEGCTEPAGSTCSQKKKVNTSKVAHRLAFRNRNRSLPGNDLNTTHEERYMGPSTCSAATALHRNSQSSNDTRFLSGDISEHSIKAGSRALLAPQLRNKLKGAAGNVARFLQAKLSRTTQDTFGQCI